MKTILRSPKKERFTTIENTLLTDKRLTWKARGIAAFLLSKPDGWNISNEYLKTQAPKNESVTTGTQELVRLGYMARFKEGYDKNRVRTVTLLAEWPAYENVGTYEERVTGNYTDPPTLWGSETTGVLVSTDLSNRSNTLSADADDAAQPSVQPTLLPSQPVGAGREAVPESTVDYTKSAQADIRDAIGEWCGYNKRSGKGPWIACTDTAKALVKDGYQLRHIQEFVKYTQRDPWKSEYSWRSGRSPSFFGEQFEEYAKSKREKPQVAVASNDGDMVL